MERKPDMETESMRVWFSNKDEVKKIEDKNGIKLKYKNMEFTMLGFTKIIDTKTKELVFAYKFKHKEKMVLYYKPPRAIDARLEQAFGTIKRLCEVCGYELNDNMEYIKKMYDERNSLEKWHKIKVKKNESKN